MAIALLSLAMSSGYILPGPPGPLGGREYAGDVSPQHTRGALLRFTSSEERNEAAIAQ